jgi:hypothetical protein
VDESRLTRHASLIRLGGLVLGLVGGDGWKLAAPVDAAACVLAPETITA